MKYLAFWEFNPEDIDLIIEKEKRVRADREKFPDKYPKVLFLPHSMGEVFKGITIFEADRPEQLVNITLHYTPELKYKFLPLFKAFRVIELYEETKKK